VKYFGSESKVARYFPGKSRLTLSRISSEFTEKLKAIERIDSKIEMWNYFVLNSDNNK